MAIKIRAASLIVVILLQLVSFKGKSYTMPAPALTSSGIQVKSLSVSEQSEEDKRKATVELLLVCDMEWGKIFNYDRSKIIDYFTVFFADVGMRFKTLPSVDISLRINEIIVLKDRDQQPFIEEGRYGDGYVNFTKMLPLFASWVYGQMEVPPKFDVAIAVTTRRDEHVIGRAYIGDACTVNNQSGMYFGTGMFHDNGLWHGVSTATHEIGHILGAPHNEKEDSSGKCKDERYVMNAIDDSRQRYFSACSDRKTVEFLRSDKAECLRSHNEDLEPLINPDSGFNASLAPTMDEQCKTKPGLEDEYENASIPTKEDRGNCTSFKCRHRKRTTAVWYEWSVTPVENSICKDNGRCFRESCRPPSWLVQNVGSGKCIANPDRFNPATDLEMMSCKQVMYGTPLDRFSIGSTQHGKMLGIPWQALNAKENGDKCIFTEDSDGGRLKFSPCDPKNKKFGWDFIDVGNSEFLLSHRLTKLCAMDTGRFVHSYVKCDADDTHIRWKFQNHILVHDEEITNSDFSEVFYLLIIPPIVIVAFGVALFGFLGC